MIGKGGNFELVQTITHQEMLLSFSLMDRGILHITTYSFTSNTCLSNSLYEFKITALTNHRAFFLAAIKTFFNTNKNVDI
jgi:hypothetical protein